MAEFPERLKEIRSRKNLTQRKVAEHLGILERSYQYYEAGRRRPDFYGLIALADYFDVSIDYLVGRSDVREVSR